MSEHAPQVEGFTPDINQILATNAEAQAAVKQAAEESRQAAIVEKNLSTQEGWIGPQTTERASALVASI